jgi:hypothetical protein
MLNGQRGLGVIVLMCHEDREGVAELLRAAGGKAVEADEGLLDLVPRLQPRPYRRD